MVIRARAGTPVGNPVNRLVTLTSNGHATHEDAVEATVTRR